MSILWSRKYKRDRSIWAKRRGEEALELLSVGARSKEELMRLMNLSSESLERCLKTVRDRIWTIQYGKIRIYERRPHE